MGEGVEINVFLRGASPVHDFGSTRSGADSRDKIGHYDVCLVH